MKLKNNIRILSTFTKDVLFDEAGSLVCTQQGGPAFYVTRVFKRESLPFTLTTGLVMGVEILLTKKGELGRVPMRPKRKSALFSNLKEKILVISTVADEFDLKGLSDFKGQVFLDIQGFVRDRKGFGKKKIWRPNVNVFENIFCLKGTKQEMENIPVKFLQQQKKKIVLITNGRRGCKVFAFGKRYIVKPKKITNSISAIGAGDTFFAYFVSAFSNGRDVVSSVKHAVAKTSEFLSFQTLHHIRLFRKEVGCD